MSGSCFTILQVVGRWQTSKLTSFRMLWKKSQFASVCISLSPFLYSIRVHFLRTFFWTSFNICLVFLLINEYCKVLNRGHFYICVSVMILPFSENCPLTIRLSLTNLTPRGSLYYWFAIPLQKRSLKKKSPSIRIHTFSNRKRLN